MDHHSHTPPVPHLFDVTGKKALITGSSRGLGRRLALALATSGAEVTLHGRDSAALAESQQEIESVTGRAARTVTFDVTDVEQVRSAIHRLIKEHGTPDILVNNAGLQRRAPIQEFDAADWDQVVASNLSSVFYVSRALIPSMITRGSGKVINIGSVQSLLARETIAPYSATKGAVAQLTKGMAADLARHGIQVNTISPGYFETDMNQDLVADEQFSQWVRRRTPAGRWGSLNELTGALLFFSSEASSFVSGQNLFVDGGMTSVV